MGTHPLLILSAAIFALQAWSFGLWLRAANRGDSQAARVALYLERLPTVIARLGILTVTWLLVACGVLGVACAFKATRAASGAARASGLILAAVNAAVAAWLLFTLM